MSLNGQNALVTGNSRGIGRDFIDWTGDIIRALFQIVSMWRQEKGGFHKPGRPDDDTGLAGDDDVTLGRTIRYSDRRTTTLLWKLPPPGR